MKRQYLGDSKDSFKWDYLDYLTVGLGSRTLRIAWMMTPDDRTSQGATEPERFPARPEILEVCRGLRTSKDPHGLHYLPQRTGGSYRVIMDPTGAFFDHRARDPYFRGLATESGEVLFLDPDNGMEPESSCSAKHVRYRDLLGLLDRIADDTVITVFQHHRRRRFLDDFAQVRERLATGYSTALFWHALMFVTVARSEQAIQQVRRVNAQYSRIRPVQVLE